MENADGLRGLGIERHSLGVEGKSCATGPGMVPFPPGDNSAGAIARSIAGQRWVTGRGSRSSKARSWPHPGTRASRWWAAYQGDLVSNR